MFKSAVLPFLFFSLALGFLLGVFIWFFPEWFTKDIWLICGFMFGITFIAYVASLFGIKNSPQTGVLIILSAIGIKLIFSMALVLIFSLKDPGIDVKFALNFFSVYLLFSAFEIYGLLRNLRHQN